MPRATATPARCGREALAGPTSRSRLAQRPPCRPRHTKRTCAKTPPAGWGGLRFWAEPGDGTCRSPAVGGGRPKLWSVAAPLPAGFDVAMTPGADTPVGRERPATRGRRALTRPAEAATIPRGVRHMPELPAPSRPKVDRGLAVRPRSLGLVFALSALVAGGAIVRWLASLAHSVPYYVADEYVYSTLARGIAEHGRPVVRGSTVAFPALLEPLLTSPFYALAGIETAFRLTQALHALEMSLAAVPVFLLARRLGLSGSVSLACAAVAITSPALFWGSFTLADPLGYVLALTAVYTAVRALSEPRLSTQAAFVAAAGLATFARTQYVVLFAVLPAAALVVERGSVRRVVRQQWLTVGMTAAALLGLVVAAASGALGPYSAWIGVTTKADVVAKSVGL